MSTPLIAPVQRLHQLAWQAGHWMDDGWWPALELTQWQNSYRDHPTCRPAINWIIAERRQFPLAALPTVLTAQQTTLMTLEPKLPSLLTALGLLAIGCPDYLRLGRYRRQLAAHLGERSCNQLLALSPHTLPSPPSLQPEQLASGAYDAGLRWWRHHAADCPVHHALSILQAPGPSQPVPALGAVIPWLLRIARFLSPC